MVQQWLGVVVNLICTLLAVVVVALAVTLLEGRSLGFTGVALMSLISLSEIVKSTIVYCRIAVAFIVSRRTNSPCRDSTGDSGRCRFKDKEISRHCQT